MVKKKECYTKKTKTGKNYTTCVEGQKKPKRKRRTKAQMAEARAMAAQDKPAPKAKAKPKKTAPKKLSAGKAVLLTQRGFMSMVGAYAIPKVERERRGREVERTLDGMFNRLSGGTGRYMVVYHNAITLTPNMAGLRRYEKGLEKTLEKYKKLTKDYKLITRKEYLSPKARKYGADTYRGNGIKMLEQLLRYIKEKREEIKKKKLQKKNYDKALRKNLKMAAAGGNEQAKQMLKKNKI